MNNRQIVLRKYPKAVIEEQHAPHCQRWFIWRDRSNKQITGDLLGCGMTRTEAWKDAANRIT